MQHKNETEVIARNETEIVDAYTQASFTMIPSRSVVFYRRFLPWQIIRFIIINIRMTIMIAMSHK